MNRKKWKAIFLAAAVAVGLTGCGAAAPASSAPSQSVPVSSSAAPASAEQQDAYVPDWRIEPYLEAANLTGLQEGAAVMRAQSVFSHLAVQTQEGGGWQFFNAATGRIFPEDVQSTGFIGMTFFDMLPFYTGDGGSNFSNVTWSEAEVQSYAETVQQEEGIQLDCGAHGGAMVSDPIWTQEGMKMLDLGICLYPADDSLTQDVMVARMVDLNKDSWAKDAYGNWNLTGGEIEYDGVVLTDSAGNRLNDTVYEDGLPYREGLAAVQLNGKWGYVDQTGTPVTEFCYEPVMTIQNWKAQPDETGNYPVERVYPYSANEGYIPVKKDGLCGVIDTQGNLVVPLQFEDITSVYDGAVWVKTDGLWGLLNLPAQA